MQCDRCVTEGQLRSLMRMDSKRQHRTTFALWWRSLHRTEWQTVTSLSDTASSGNGCEISSSRNGGTASSLRVRSCWNPQRNQYRTIRVRIARHCCIWPALCPILSHTAHREPSLQLILPLKTSQTTSHHLLLPALPHPTLVSETTFAPFTVSLGPNTDGATVVTCSAICCTTFACPTLETIVVQNEWNIPADGQTALNSCSLMAIYYSLLVILIRKILTFYCSWGLKRVRCCLVSNKLHLWAGTSSAAWTATTARPHKTQLIYNQPLNPLQ